MTSDQPQGGSALYLAGVCLAAADSASQALTGTAYYDNFIVQQRVPEPASLLLALWGAFAAVLMGYRTRRAQD